MITSTTFIESQFPVSKLSKESYKERKAVSGQTLTGLGKWWGRKPLVLARAVILGLLLPATDEPHRDREVYLKLMTMDEAGLLRRRNKSFSIAELYERLSEFDRQQYFDYDADEGTAEFKPGIERAIKEKLQEKAFKTLSYDEKLDYCKRPEQIDGPDEEAWADINAHLGTHASSLAELVRELGERRFGHVPRVGDAFCGGGSIPFEAARLGCEAFGSDLNPVAALLTWGALNIVGGGPEVRKRVLDAQRKAYAAVNQKIMEWKIEHNENGWRADAYLYCTETICPECGWTVPLSGTWLIAEKTHTIAVLKPNEKRHNFDFEIISDATAAQVAEAKLGSVRDSELVCPKCQIHTEIASIRGDGRADGGPFNRLRLWDKDDIVPRPDDTFQERLYCIRWVEKIDEIVRTVTRRHYCAPTEDDLRREAKVVQLLKERFANWQAEGTVPSWRIEPGDKTDEPIRTKGWTHWHHLFNSRQLLLAGLFAKQIDDQDIASSIVKLLVLGRIVNLNSRLCRWLPIQSGGSGGGKETFDNQALNTLYNYSCRAFLTLESCAVEFLENFVSSDNDVAVCDARNVTTDNDLWITDPPYADAINYHELTEFFLTWYEKHLLKVFPHWYADSKRALAVRGSDENFRQSMVDCYRNLAQHMPDDGLQVVMFTHQDASVWADLALILWAAGLRVTAAWTIATETESALKKGNYVQGTVLLVLRKQTSQEVGFLDEIMQEIDPQVKKQLDAMMALDDREDPNFSDSDYQLAAYAAALRVITRYASVEEINLERELTKVRAKGEVSPLEAVIERAVKIASNYLIPSGLHDSEAARRDIWRGLSAEERFYLKGLDVESHGEQRQGVYQEFARGFGLKEYTNLLHSGKANESRLKTASEFKGREFGTAGFGASLVRAILFAVHKTVETESADAGLRWLHDETPDGYWNRREAILAILRYLSRLDRPHWQRDAEAAAILAGRVENDSV